MGRYQRTMMATCHHSQATVWLPTVSCVERSCQRYGTRMTFILTYMRVTSKSLRRVVSGTSGRNAQR